MLIISSLAILFGCDATNGANNSDNLWYIFPVDQAHLVERQCSRPSPGPIDETWQPTETTIVNLLEPLRELLQHEIEEYNTRFARRNIAAQAEALDYSFQFAGLVIEGQKVIYVNGMQSKEVNSLLGGDISSLFLICDGGAITFGVEYVVSERTFRNFQFNGHA
ncbi:MAG: hypothetical protein AAF950_07075 [Pseudomonadota bacterium]